MNILGHEHKSMSYRVYSAGAAVRPLYEAICKIEYDLKCVAARSVAPSPYQRIISQEAR